MALFIHLTRSGPPVREVLVNIDRILLVQENQNGKAVILFGNEHTITFEESSSTIEDRIAHGPYVRTDHA